VPLSSEEDASAGPAELDEDAKAGCSFRLEVVASGFDGVDILCNKGVGRERGLRIVEFWSVKLLPMYDGSHTLDYM
jgi:hypothetical protein